MNLLFVGQVSLPESFFIPFLSKHGYSTTVISTDLGKRLPAIPGTDIAIYSLYDKSIIRQLFEGRLGLLKKAAFYRLIGSNPKLFSKVNQVIEKDKIDVIYGSWGTQGIPEFKLLQNFEVPTIYEFRCYPSNELDFAVQLENFLVRNVVRGFSGRVFPTERMFHYVCNKFGIPFGNNTVFEESYPKQCFFRKRLPLLSEKDGQRHLLFIGMDAYDILPQIKEIIGRQIHVHCLLPKESRLKNSRFIKIFKPFTHDQLSNGEFGTFMTQFDACLVTYNFAKATCLERFQNTIPNRFAFALTGGIPIVLPKGYFKGCEDFIKKHDIGFAFSDFSDLNKKLNEEKLMEHYRKTSISKSPEFTLETNFHKIDSYIRQFCRRTPE